MGPTFDPSHATLVETTYLWEHFCQGPELNASCDEYFIANNFTQIEGIPGLSSGILSGECMQLFDPYFICEAFHYRDILIYS